MAKSFYAIKKGKKTGVFTGQWKEIEKKYIKGFSYPQFKGFDTREDAENYLMEAGHSKKKSLKSANNNNQLAKEHILLTKKQRKKQKKAFLLDQKKARAIVFDRDNTIHQQLSKIKLIISCHHNNMGGFYRSILIHGDTDKFNKVSPSPLIEDASANRAMIIGIIEQVSILTSPSHIKIHSKTNFGYQSMIRSKKSPNSDKLVELRNILYTNGHVIEEIMVDETAIKAYFSSYQ